MSEFRQKINFVTEKQIVRLKVGLYSGLIFFSFFTIIAVSVTTVCELTLTSHPFFFLIFFFIFFFFSTLKVYWQAIISVFVSRLQS